MNLLVPVNEFIKRQNHELLISSVGLPCHAWSADIALPDRKFTHVKYDRSELVSLLFSTSDDVVIVIRVFETVRVFYVNVGY